MFNKVCASTISRLVVSIVDFKRPSTSKLAEQLKLFSFPDSRHNVGVAALCCANTAMNVQLLSKDNVN